MKRVLGAPKAATLATRPTICAPLTSGGEPETVEIEASLTTRAEQKTEVTDRYFELTGQIIQAKRRGDYKAAVAVARATFPLLAPFVQSVICEYGQCNITLCHAVYTASTLMAVEQDAIALATTYLTQ